MTRVVWLFIGGLTSLGVACANGTSQSVAAPTPVVAAVENPPPSTIPAPATGIVITPAIDLRAGAAALFTFTVTGRPLLNLRLGWGDDTVTDVGATTHGVLSHVYAFAGAYTLTVITTDAAGRTATAESGPLIVK